MGWGGGAMMMLFWLVVLGAIAWGVWAAARHVGFGAGGDAGEDSAERVLRERYARGEIDEASYRRMLETLRRH